MTATYGINGNFSQPIDYRANESGRWESPELVGLGVKYHGDGDWTLPDGATIIPLGGDDWRLTLEDGREVELWTEE